MLTDEQNTKLQRLIADRLLEQLTFIPFEPEHILNFGCNDEYLLQKLQEYYPTAQLYGCINKDNLDRNKFKNNNIFCGSEKIPLRNHSIDLVVFNLFINNLPLDLNQFFQELQRVITLQGLLLFTVINNNYAAIEQENVLVLNIGDLLLINKFCDPVVTQEIININQSLIGKLIFMQVIYGHALNANAIVNINIPIYLE